MRSEFVVCSEQPQREVNGKIIIGVVLGACTVYLTQSSRSLLFTSPHLTPLYARRSVATINLSDNQLSFESAIIIAEYLMWSETIDEIILDGNEIDDKGMQVLLEGIEENKSLSSLSMDRCNLGPVSLNWIASTAQSYYIDNINLVRDTGIKSANEKLETYTDVIENMGGFVDNLEDKLLELKEEEEGLY